MVKWACQCHRITIPIPWGGKIKVFFAIKCDKKVQTQIYKQRNKDF